MQVFKNEKVVYRPRDYREIVRRSKLCKVDKFSAKMDGYGPLLGQNYENPSQPQSPKAQKDKNRKENNMKK